MPTRHDAEEPRLHPAANNNVADISMPNTGVESVTPMSTVCADSLPAVPGYRLVRELGRGAMGVVYEAIDIGLNRAKFTDAERRRTRSGMFLGTLGYIAPELIDTPETASAAPGSASPIGSAHLFDELFLFQQLV